MYICAIHGLQWDQYGVRNSMSAHTDQCNLYKLKRENKCIYQDWIVISFLSSSRGKCNEILLIFNFSAFLVYALSDIPNGWKFEKYYFLIFVIQFDFYLNLLIS